MAALLLRLPFRLGLTLPFMIHVTRSVIYLRVLRGLPMQQQLPEMRVAVTCWLFPLGLMAIVTLCNLTSSTRLR